MIANNQKGMTFIGLVLVIAAVVCIAVVGMKVAPAYGEYGSIKKAVKKAASEGSSKKEISDSFDKAALIDDIKQISSKDLIIKDGVVSVDYQVVLPIIANASILLDFSASSAAK
jgi:Domain of unknown function (DUF4845)